MGTATGAAARAKSPSKRPSKGTVSTVETRTAETRTAETRTAEPKQDVSKVLTSVLAWLDEAKAEDIVAIDLNGKSTLADHMVIASGRSDRHVGAIGDQLHKKLKEGGAGRVRVEGMDACDWVLIDTGDLIIHIFRPEVREFYKLEKMWSGDRPGDDTAH